MSALTTAFSTFSSCNKAGSIPLFTKHLETYPNDFTALRWRGRAHDIIGDLPSARADFSRAMSVSVDPYRSLAEADLVYCDERNIFRRRRCYEILQKVTQNHPRFAEVWHVLGSRFFIKEISILMLTKAVALGKENGETKSPWYPWCNYQIGTIYLENSYTKKAKMYFNEAIASCSSLTVGHLGLCDVSIMENNLCEAEKHFRTARELNPKLIVDDDFEAYRLSVLASTARNRNKSNRNRKGGGPNGGDGSSNGDKGSSDNDGNDDDGKDDARKKWKKIKAASPWIAKHRGRILALDEKEEFWYSYDTAGHGGAVFKKYKNKGNSLEFVGSTDKDLNDIKGKHESNEGVTIFKSDLDTVRRN